MAKYIIRHRGHQLIGGYKWHQSKPTRWFISAFIAAALLHFQGWQQVEIKKNGKKKNETT